MPPLRHFRHAMLPDGYAAMLPLLSPAIFAIRFSAQPRFSAF